MPGDGKGEAAPAETGSGGVDEPGEVKSLGSNLMALIQALTAEQAATSRAAAEAKRESEELRAMFREFIFHK